MKRIIMALVSSYIMVHPAPCQEKAGMAGVNATSFIVGSVDVLTSFAFSNHWSITAEASVPYKRLLKDKSDLEHEHDAEFTTAEDNSEDNSEDTALPGASLLINYWPRQSFTGPTLSVGIQSIKTPDLIIEAGYAVQIWKGFLLHMAFRIPFIESFTHERIDSRNLRLGLCYKF